MRKISGNEELKYHFVVWSFINLNPLITAIEMREKLCQTEETGTYKPSHLQI